MLLTYIKFCFDRWNSVLYFQVSDLEAFYLFQFLIVILLAHIFALIFFELKG